MKMCNIHLVSTFPMSALEPKIVLGCAWCFSPPPKTIKDADGKVIINLDPNVIKNIFKLPHNSKCVDFSKEMSLWLWNQSKLDYMRHTNENWLEKKRSNFSRRPKTIQKSDFYLEVNDLITLLRRVCGLKEFGKFESWMYKFILQIFDNKEPIYWGELISTTLCEQLIHVRTSTPFYMNS